MALIVLTSASGAPGVTTSTLALALAWPRPVVLIEADPAGGSAILAGYCRGEVPHDRGLVDLALAHRAGDDLAAVLPTLTMRLPGTSVDLLPGLRSHAQAASVAPVWERLAIALTALDRTGTDVLVDAGRLGMVGAPTPLLRAADATLLVTRTSLPALAGARPWAKTLRQDLPPGGTAQHLGLLLIGEGHPYSAREIDNVLNLPVVAALAWDPVAAETFHLGAAPSRRFEHGALARSVRAAVSAIRAQVTANRDLLDPGALLDLQEVRP